ncbi:hypothetical protein EV213_12124 [Aureibacillus halotolerans]|uniref:Uncharacterized protein n=1 Tax=Aureibacillus halotolerans TaxID=1508390 RepID=A0A4R6TSD5_9BACI|nr:hypothetical protein EV213_12124 [Aureibacillus halotolerans]
MLPNFRSKQGAFSPAYRTYVKEKERSRGRKGGDRCLLASFKTRPSDLSTNLFWLTIENEVTRTFSFHISFTVKVT